MITLLALAQATAQITITATVVAGCQTTITGYLDDSAAPREDMYLSCSRGVVATVNTGPRGPLQQAGFGAPEVYTFERGGMMHIPLPRANRGLFVSLQPASPRPRTVVIRFQ